MRNTYFFNWNLTTIYDIRRLLKVLKNVRWGYVDLFLVLFFNLSIRIINLLEPKIDVLLQNFMVASRSHVATQKCNFPLQGVFTNAILAVATN